MSTPFVLTARIQTVLDRKSLRYAQQVIRRTFSRRPLNLDVIINDRHLRNLTKRLTDVDTHARRAQTGIAGFANSIRLATTRFAAFAIGAGIMMRMAQAFRQGLEEAIKFDRELVRIGQVTGRTKGGMSGLVKEITKLSESLGVSSLKMVEMTKILAQTGLSATDTSLAMKALAKTELAPTFSNIEKTAEGAIAMMRQFGIAAVDLESKLGAINAVSKRFAVESDDIITAIRRTGGVFEAAGGSVEELIALFTSVRATTRETAETIATGLRTIFTRIQRPKTIKFLKQFGVELTDLQGNFVGPMEAVRRLSVALNQFETTDLRFGKIIEQLGGFRQVGKVIPMITKHHMAQKALNVAMSGGNSLALDAAKAQEALEVKFAKVKEEFMDMTRQLVASEGFQSFISMTLKLASALVKLAESIIPLLPLLTALGSVKLGAMAMGGISSAVSGAGGIGAMATPGMMGGGIMAMGALAPMIADMAGATEESKEAVNAFSQSITTVGFAVMLFGQRLGASGTAALAVAGAFWAYGKMLSAEAKKAKELAIERGQSALAAQQAAEQVQTDQAGVWAGIAGTVGGTIAMIVTGMAVAAGTLATFPAVVISVLVAAVAAAAAWALGYKVELPDWLTPGGKSARTAARQAEAAANASANLERMNRHMSDYNKELDKDVGARNIGKMTQSIVDASVIGSAGVARGLVGGIDVDREEFSKLFDGLVEAGSAASTHLSTVAVQSAKNAPLARTSAQVTADVIAANKDLIASIKVGAGAQLRLSALQMRKAAEQTDDAKKRTEMLWKANQMEVDAHMASYDAEIKAKEQIERDVEQTKKRIAAERAQARLFAVHARITKDLSSVTKSLAMATIEATEAMKGISAATSLGLGKVGSTKVKGARGSLLTGGIANVKDSAEFASVVNEVTAPLGAAGAEAAKHVTDSARLFQELPEEILRNTDPATGMLNKQFLKSGGGLDKFMRRMGNVPQEVKEDVRASLVGIASDASPEKVMEALQKAGAKLDPVLKKLHEIYKAQLEHLNRLNKAYDGQRKLLGALAKSEKDMVTHAAKATATMKKHLGMERTIADGRMAFHMEQQAILGQGGMGHLAGNIAGMGVALRNTNAQIVQAEKDMEKVVGDPTKAKLAAENLAKLKNESESLTNALKHATNMADQRSIIEEKIAKAKEERESRKGLLEEFTFGSKKQRRQMGKDLRVTQFAAAVGDMDRIPDKFRGTVLKTLDRFKDTLIPGAGGRTGQEVKNQLMARQAMKMGASPEQIKRLMYRGREEEMLINELGSLFAQESAARMELMKTQQQANVMLTAEIQKMHQDFVNRLNAMLAQVAALQAGRGPAQQANLRASKAQSRVDEQNRQNEERRAKRDRDLEEDRVARRVGPTGPVRVFRSGMPQDPSFHKGGEVNATLQDGEYVIQRKAAKKIGSKNLDNLNKMHKGGPVGHPHPHPPLGLGSSSTQYRRGTYGPYAHTTASGGVGSGPSSAGWRSYGTSSGVTGDKQPAARTPEQEDLRIYNLATYGVDPNDPRPTSEAERAWAKEHLKMKADVAAQNPIENYSHEAMKRKMAERKAAAAKPMYEQTGYVSPDYKRGPVQLGGQPVTPPSLLEHRSAEAAKPQAGLSSLPGYAGEKTQSEYDAHAPLRAADARSKASAAKAKAEGQAEGARLASEESGNLIPRGVMTGRSTAHVPSGTFDSRVRHLFGRRGAAARRANRFRTSSGPRIGVGFPGGPETGHKLRRTLAKNRQARMAKRAHDSAVFKGYGNVGHMQQARRDRYQARQAQRRRGLFGSRAGSRGGRRLNRRMMQANQAGAFGPGGAFGQGGNAGIAHQVQQTAQQVQGNFAGVDVQHTINHQGLNVTGGDGIGSAIIQQILPQIVDLIKNITTQLINNSSPNAAGQLTVRP